MENELKEMILSYFNTITKTQKIRTKKGFAKIRMMGAENITICSREYISTLMKIHIDTTFGLINENLINKIIDDYTK